MSVSLVKMNIEDYPEARSADLLALSKQKTSGISKEELLCDNTVLAVCKIYIDALYYNKMFYSTVF